MANRTLNVRLLIRNDLAATWTSANPVLLKGEMGIEIDTKKFKFGDGSTPWNTLPYSSSQLAVTNENAPTATDYSYELGTLWIKSSTPQRMYLLISNASNAAVWKEIPSLDDVINQIEDDIEDLELGTASKKDVGTAEGNVPVLGANGKLDTSVIPALAITDVFVVDSQEAMLALDAQQGDVAVRTDEKKTYILKQTPATTLANWVELETPADSVTSVNGQVGVVNLTTDNIAEGSTNQYFTETRATANFNENIAKAKVADLSDGSDVLMATDTYVLDGGNAATGNA